MLYELGAALVTAASIFVANFRVVERGTAAQDQNLVSSVLVHLSDALRINLPLQRESMRTIPQRIPLQTEYVLAKLLYLNGCSAE